MYSYLLIDATLLTVPNFLAVLSSNPIRSHGCIIWAWDGGLGSGILGRGLSAISLAEWLPLICPCATASLGECPFCTEVFLLKSPALCEWPIVFFEAWCAGDSPVGLTRSYVSGATVKWKQYRNTYMYMRRTPCQNKVWTSGGITANGYSFDIYQ